VKQDKTDAQTTVDGRLQFIDGQMSVFLRDDSSDTDIINRKDTEKSIGTIRDKSENKKIEASHPCLI
jgi:small nuclear ribonucleoprotein (snRNP)-like protein